MRKAEMKGGEVQKIVINELPGGRFRLSYVAAKWMACRGHRGMWKALRSGAFGLGGVEWPGHFTDANRADPVLVGVVEALGFRASGVNANLQVVEVPEGIKWNIHEEHGVETVREAHRYWGSFGEAPEE